MMLDDAAAVLAAAVEGDYFIYTAETQKRTVTRVIIHGSVGHIRNKAFMYFADLEDVVRHEGLRTIGIRTFFYCYSLLCIIISSSVTSIIDDAFGSCTSLVEVVLHDGLQTIGNRTFSNCSSLISINIPSSVTSLKNHAFSGCHPILCNIH
jgi:hypothetical protein